MKQFFAERSEKLSGGHELPRYILALLLFGSNGVVASAIHLGSVEIVLLRSTLGCILLAALFFATGNRLNLNGSKRDLLFVALSGVAMAADWLFLFEAYAEIGVSLGMLINYTGPAIVIALSPVVLGERVAPRKIVALVCALAGACLISGQAVISGLSVRGLICSVLSAFSYAVMVLANKKARSIVGIENAALQMFFCAATVVLFCPLRATRFTVLRGDWLPILWLGLVNTGLGCYFYFFSIGKLPAQSVAVCGYIEPLSAVLLSALILRESLSGVQVLGAALILGGALFGELGSSWHSLFPTPGKKVG